MIRVLQCTTVENGDSTGDVHQFRAFAFSSQASMNRYITDVSNDRDDDVSVTLTVERPDLYEAAAALLAELQRETECNCGGIAGHSYKCSFNESTDRKTQSCGPDHGSDYDA